MEPEAFGAALEEIRKEERRTTNNEPKMKEEETYH